MILSATKGTSFHLTTCSRYCSLPSFLLLFAPLSLSVGIQAALPSYYLCPAMHSGGGMLLSHASHAHSLLWHAAPSDNTFSIKGPRRWHTVKQLFLSVPTPHTLIFFLSTSQTNTTNHVGTQRTAAIQITSVWNIKVVYITEQQGTCTENKLQTHCRFVISVILDSFIYHLFIQVRILLSMHALCQHCFILRVRHSRLRAAEFCVDSC